MPSSLQLNPADIFGEVRIYPAGLAIVPFVLALLFCRGNLATPRGAVRLFYGIEDAGDGRRRLCGDALRSGHRREDDIRRWECSKDFCLFSELFMRSDG
ncbi:MAG: hypothetical protein SPL35_06850 [Bacteroidales bacterium]|nr:hypothetical protein [Bacteroidales bacterium]